MNKKYSYRIKAVHSSLETALDPVLEALEELNVDHKVCFKIRLALEEALVNVVSYAYDDDNGEVEIRYEISDDPCMLIITIIDEGRPFNPLEAEDPLLSSDINQRKIGGLGLYIIKNTMDEVEYHRENNQNILIIKKNF